LPPDSQVVKRHRDQKWRTGPIHRSPATEAGDDNSQFAQLREVIQEGDLRIDMLSDEISALLSRKKWRRKLSAWWHSFLHANSR